MIAKTIPRFHKYSINENGVVTRDGHVKSQWIGKINGYCYVDLWKENKSYKFTTHRLIAITFIPNPKNLPNVLHRDGNKKNNSVSNLYWGTQKENTKDRQRHGRHFNGEKNPSAKLTNEQANKIKKLFDSGLFQREVGKLFGVSRATVSDIWKGRRRSYDNSCS